MKSDRKWLAKTNCKNVCHLHAVKTLTIDLYWYICTCTMYFRLGVSLFSFIVALWYEINDFFGSDFPPMFSDKNLSLYHIQIFHYIFLKSPFLSKINDNYPKIKRILWRKKKFIIYAWDTNFTLNTEFHIPKCCFNL